MRPHAIARHALLLHFLDRVFRLLDRLRQFARSVVLIRLRGLARLLLTKFALRLLHFARRFVNRFARCPESVSGFRPRPA